MNDALRAINSTLGPREAASANGKLSSHRDRLWDELRDFDPADAECTTEEAVRALLGQASEYDVELASSTVGVYDRDLVSLPNQPLPALPVAELADEVAASKVRDFQGHMLLSEL